MSPAIALENMSNTRFGASHDFSDLIVGMSVISQDSNLANHFGGQVGTWMRFAAMLATLARLILHVACLSVKPKVIGIDAARIITGMAYGHVGRRFDAMMELPRKTIGAVSLALVGEFPITFGVDVARPLPTLIEAFGLEAGAETFFKGCTKKIGATLLLLREWGAGILIHVVSSLIAIGQSRGRYQRRSAISIGYYSFILAHLVEYCKAQGGFNHERIGYPTARAMFEAFANAPMQTLGFINFCLSDPDLLAAIRRKDWRAIAKLYNGAGAIDTYAPLLERAYNELGG